MAGTSPTHEQLRDDQDRRSHAPQDPASAGRSRVRHDGLIRGHRNGVPHAGRNRLTAADGDVHRELGSRALHNIDQPHLPVARAFMAGNMAKRAAALAAAKREFVAA